jgi:hypothetical protein
MLFPIDVWEIKVPTKPKNSIFVLMTNVINFFYNLFTLVKIKMWWSIDRSNDERPPTFNLNFAKNRFSVAG